MNSAGVNMVVQICLQVLISFPLDIFFCLLHLKFSLTQIMHKEHRCVDESIYERLLFICGNCIIRRKGLHMFNFVRTCLIAFWCVCAHLHFCQQGRCFHFSIYVPYLLFCHSDRHGFNHPDY